MSQTPELRTDRGPGRPGEPAGGGRRDRTIRFIETLGRGGFGAVYLAEVETSEGLVQRLAVKVLSAEMSGHNDIAGRQRDEARLLSRLNHDNIVKVFDLTTVHNRPAVMMEFVDGADAAELVKRGRFSPRAALQVVAATASALHTAFSAPAGRGGQPLRVIHRDIKPANLLVSRHGGVKVLDFGIARGDFDREGKTESVQFGTARYMAPEQWLYAQISHAVDIYALGVTLAELMAGQQLGRAPLSPEKFKEHVGAVLDELITPDLPPAAGAELAELLRGMLAFAPEDRFSADQVYERAIGLIDDLPGEGLNRLAARLVPACVEQRKERFRNDPVLDAISVSHETVSPTGSGTQLPPGAPLTPAGFAVPTAPEPPPVSSPWSGSRPIPSDQTRAVLEAETVRAAVPKAQSTLPPPPPVSGPTITPAAGRTASPRTISPASRPSPASAPPAVPVTPVETPRPAQRSALLPIGIALGFLFTLGIGAVGTFAWVSQKTPEPAPEMAPTAEAAPPAEAPVEVVAAAPSATEPPVATPAVIADASGSKQKNTSAGKPPPAGSDTEPENTRIVPTSSASTTTVAAAPAEAPPPARSEPAPRNADPPPAAAAEAPATEQVNLKFTSKPLGAEVYLDGRSLGVTPRTVKVPVGEHNLRFVSGELSASKTIQVTASTPPHYSWKADTNVISNQQ